MAQTVRIADVEPVTEVIIHSAAAGSYADHYLQVLAVETSRDGKWVTIEFGLRGHGVIREIDMPADTLAYIYSPKGRK